MRKSIRRTRNGRPEVYLDPDPDQKSYRSLVTYDRTRAVAPRCLPEAALQLYELFPEE